MMSFDDMIRMARLHHSSGLDELAEALEDTSTHIAGPQRRPGILTIRRPARGALQRPDRLRSN